MPRQSIKRREDAALNAEHRARGEGGLGTLEWILIVAAVGGLATLGVLIARGAADEAGSSVDESIDRLTSVAEQYAADHEEIVAGQRMLFGEHARFGCSSADSPWAEEYGHQFTFRWSLDYDKDGENDIDLAERNPDGSVRRTSDGDIEYDYGRGYCRAFPLS